MSTLSVARYKHQILKAGHTQIRTYTYSTAIWGAEMSPIYKFLSRTSLVGREWQLANETSKASRGRTGVPSHPTAGLRYREADMHSQRSLVRSAGHRLKFLLHTGWAKSCTFSIHHIDAIVQGKMKRLFYQNVLRVYENKDSNAVPIQLLNIFFCKLAQSYHTKNVTSAV